MSSPKLVLVRHGQSEWNAKNLFTGWKDVDLSSKGLVEAQGAGQKLLKENIKFDLAFSSVLKRAIRTLWIILDEMDLMSIPVCKTPCLNERNYGSLQGKNKDEVIKKYGKEQVQLWRRDFLTAPPEGESLKQTKDRLTPFWQDNILPHLLASKSVLIVAHGNSLRALIKTLENISDSEISKINLPTAQPIVYTMDSKGGILNKASKEL